MKIFKFPGGRITNIDREQNKSPKMSYPKKYGSLDLTYFFTNKNRELQRVYRTNSCEKKTRNKSSNSTKSTHQPKQPSKIYPPYKIKNPKKDFTHPSKKIFLQTEKKGKYLYNDIKFTLQLLCQRLSRCLEVKSQKIFTQEYKQAIKFNMQDDKENNQSILHSFVQKLCLCQQRQLENKMQAQQDKINTIEKQKVHLSIEVKKLKIKEQNLNNQIKKLNQNIIEITKQIKKLKQRSVANQFTQTQKQNCQILIQDYENNGEFHHDFSKLIQQLRISREKQNHMNILLAQLRRDGVNLQKIYNKGLRYLKMTNNQSQNSSENESQTQNENTMKDGNSPKIHRKKIKNKHESDADDSIIDDIQALSFNFQDKQDEIEAYSPRRVYVCKKKIDQHLKKQLELNFQCLYEENQEVYQDQQTKYNNSEGCPTI